MVRESLVIHEHSFDFQVDHRDPCFGSKKALFRRSNVKDNCKHTYFSWEDQLAIWTMETRVDLLFHPGTPTSQ